MMTMISTIINDVNGNFAEKKRVQAVSQLESTRILRFRFIMTFGGSRMVFAISIKDII